MTLLTPEYLQTQKYSALRDRLAYEHSGRLQPGVFDAGDFKVTQRAAGANLSVDVALGCAVVDASQPSNQGFYHIQNDASVNVTTGASNGHATLPRIDSVVVQVQDSTHGGASSDVPLLKIIPGTATSGASLDAPSGAPTIPTGSMRLADILMPAGGTTYSTTNIRDRRTWARGAFYGGVRTAGDVAAPAASWTAIGPEFTQRVELSGKPVRFGYNLAPNLTSAGVGDYIVRILANGTPINGTNSFDRYPNLPVNRQNTCVGNDIWLPPAAGSYLIQLQHQAGTGTIALAANGALPATFYIEEIVIQNVSNGTA